MVLLAAIAMQTSPLRAQGPAPVDPRPQNGEADLVCGPRCVRQILGIYGMPEPDLIDLVREMQWPDIEAGSSLAAVDEALRRRGVHTARLRVGPQVRVRWPHPVIIHIDGDEGGGHYIVRVPSDSDRYETVWTGLGGWRRGPWDEVSRGRSGAILITAPVPIHRPSDALYDPSRAALAAGWAVVALLATSAIVGALIRVARGPRTGPAGDPTGPSPRPERVGSP
jgi:hypothetical protein